MKRTAQLTVEVPAAPDVVAADVSDPRKLEKLHPLLRSIARVDDAAGVRRCKDRIFGLKRVYFAEQHWVPGALKWHSVVRQGALTLTNVWSVTRSRGRP
ncbi:MAG: hypothetical protein JNK82_22685 [Myxococcaceae bacterium]|nr:hypothetical protein [Myxococcaceae bacterium]